SLFDLWLPYIGASDFQLSPTYYDYQAKLHWHASANDDLDVFIFGADDLLTATLKRPDPRLAGALDSHIYYHRALARYTHRIGKATITITPSIGYDQPFQLKSSLGDTDTEIDAHTVEYALRAVARVPLASFLRLDAGLDFEGTRWNISANNAPAGGQPREGDSGGFGPSAGVATSAINLDVDNTAPYVGLHFSFFGKRLTIDPQLRIDLYAFSGYGGSPDAFSRVYAETEPRLSARWQIRPWVALKGAIGVYHQPPDPSAFLKQFGNPGIAPELSLHYVLGADFDPTSTLHIEVEGFYKDLRQLIVRGEDPADPALDNDGIGRVYGAELLVRQELFKNFFGWISYTLSRSERRDHPDEPWRVFQFDQTHILTLVASYKLPRGYQIGVRFRYVTGDPDTPVVGSYYDAASGTYRPINGPLYSARLTDFHQLDVRFDKTWTFNRWKLALYLDIQNVYDHQSEERITYNFDFTKSAPITGLPIVPAFGVRGEF
ncbi:MAG: TonB-dependent receptor plug domain-containing protein, partial [Polyangia bacterium]